MDILGTFHMEDALEKGRFQLPINLGESGNRPRTLTELLPSQLDQTQLLQLSLRDSPNFGRDDLRALIANFHDRATPENVLVTTGTSEALLLLFRQLKPRKVACMMPCFQLLTEIPKALGAEIVSLPVQWDSDNRPFADWTQWFQTLRTQRPDVLVFNHPHNPSGMVFSDTDLARLSVVCAAINCVIVADEHYRFLVCGRQLGPTLWNQGPANTFVTGSYIKCIGAPGLRIGWCVGNPRVISAMQSEKNYTTHTVNPVSEFVSVKILSNLNSDLFQEIRTQWEQNRQELVHAQVGICPPDGGLVTCYFPKDSSGRNLDSHRHRIVAESLQSQGIFLLPLDTFEPGLCGFRIGLGSSQAHLQAALTAIQRLGFI